MTFSEYISYYMFSDRIDNHMIIFNISYIKYN